MNCFPNVRDISQLLYEKDLVLIDAVPKIDSHRLPSPNQEIWSIAHSFAEPSE